MYSIIGLLFVNIILQYTNFISQGFAWGYDV